MTFGSRLRQARELKQLTQAQLGRGLGTDGKDVTKAVVSGWEKDQHAPRVDQLALICDRLGCGADYLLFGKVSDLNVGDDMAQLAKRVDGLRGKLREAVLATVEDALEIALASSANPNVVANDEALLSPADLAQLRRRRS
jgi:transcriptional regulator with XRE-family HTH domain